MLKCAIPKCCSREKSLRSGTIHLADVPRNDGSASKRMIWLCDACSRRFCVQSWRPAGEQIRPRSHHAGLTLADLFPAQVAQIDPRVVAKML